jgi:hypothetical protein
MNNLTNLKRPICICLLIFMSLSLSAQVFGLSTRTWTSNRDDDGSIHAIGNGNMLVYEQGPEITRLFGSSYSSPSFLRMLIDDSHKTLNAESRREMNTAIWHHHLLAEGKTVARITDYILEDKNLFFRDFNISEEVTVTVIPSQEARLFALQHYFSDSTDEVKASFLLTIPAGTNFFVNHPVTEELSLLLVAIGNIELPEPEDETFSLKVKPGKARLIISSYNSLPQTTEAMEYVLGNPETNWLQQSRDYWLAFSRRRLDFESMIPQNHPGKDTLLDVIDAVSIALKCQQSVSGGIMAGHKYNMAYTRDQSGVLRGFLALGYWPEAKAILDFWIRKHSLFGNVLTAEGMDNDAARLTLINDEAEGPAYLIHNCFLYYEYTHDHKFLESALTMMTWAFEVQLSHVVEGMTEFSGDETYVNGRTIRCDVYDGSAESTLLFITGGEKLLNWVEENGFWEKGKIEMYRRVVEEAKVSYRQNFMADGVLYANNPERKKLADLPRFRFGFCSESRSHTTDIPLITWTERQKDGRYVCPACIHKPPTGDRSEILNEKRFVLNSVNLVPVYIESNLFTREETKQLIKPGVDLFKSEGRVPSNVDETRSLGYDYGLFLYNMVRLNNPLKERALHKMLSTLNSVGAWDEYYDNDISTPGCCKTRPWESGINIDALTEYICSLE